MCSIIEFLWTDVTYTYACAIGLRELKAGQFMVVSVFFFFFLTDYLQPFVKQLDNVSKISIRSQVLYMTGLNVSPQWSSSYSHFALPEEQLPLTINAIEAKLGMIQIHVF